MATSVNYASSSLGDERLEEQFEEALRRIRATPAAPEPQLIGDQQVSQGSIIERFDPCVPGALVGAAHEATSEHVAAAVRMAKSQARTWRRTPYQDRVTMLKAARPAVAEQLVDLAAIVSAETGKTRLEAVGEVQEVLDMIDHYCNLMVENHGYAAALKSTDAEHNSDVLVPYGTFAVISPFNFPVALAVGMMVGALVTGNTVVIKPSDKTPRSTTSIARLLRAHLPTGVLNVVHGGAAVGRKLAAEPVDGIAFTGSAQVGWELAAGSGPNGRPRPVLAEMGGQNPAIVTRTANLDDAAAGIVRSAFGLSGQKCSACRRVVVDDSVADELLSKLVDLAGAMVVGDPIDRATSLGPVIDDAIATRVDAALQAAQRDGKVVAGGRAARDGNFFEPVIVTDLPRDHPLTRDELFAPFLTVTRVTSFDAALEEANAVDYGLTAGIFSGSQEEIDRFLDEIEAGVVYVNRKAGATTGAWPGVQSFCGWKLSGSMGKGGLGLWYLPGFMREQSRTVVTTA